MEERLRKFAYLVDAGSFTKAAAELHVSQPALSSAVAKLERELKTLLLVRGARPLVLTPAGSIAYQTAKDLAVQTDNLKLRMAELSGQTIALRIGMIDSVANALFAEGASLEMLESAKVSIVVNNSRYLLEAALHGELDIAFVAEQSKPLPAPLEAKLVASEPLVVVSNASHPDLRGNTLPNFIGYDQPSNTFRLVRRALQGYDVVPQISFYSTSPEVMLRLVLLNKGIAALPYLMVYEHLQTGQLVRLGSPKPWLISRTIVALKRRDKQLPSALKQLIDQTAVVLEELLRQAQS